MINIIEIQRKMEQGVTQPWLCRGDDGKNYVVKRLNATLNGCIYEWIAGNLGRRFGLNIPKVQLVYIDQSLLEFDYEKMSELGAGIAFASEFHSHLNEINIHDLKSFDEEVLIDLFVFDYWLKNDDRTLTEKGGNPNLYQSLVTKKLVVFDHNLAFDPDFDFSSFKSLHVASFLFRGQRDLFVKPIKREAYQPRLVLACSELDLIVAALPDEWLEGIDSGELERLRLVLNDFKRDEFWEALI